MAVTQLNLHPVVISKIFFFSRLKRECHILLQLERRRHISNSLPNAR